MLIETEVRNTSSKEMKSGWFVNIGFILRNSKTIKTIYDSLKSRGKKKSQDQTGNGFHSWGEGSK